MFNRFAEEEKSEVNDDREDKEDDDEDEHEEDGVPGEEPFGVSAFAPKDKPKVKKNQYCNMAYFFENVFSSLHFILR